MPQPATLPLQGTRFPIVTGVLKPLGYQQVTSLSSATALTLTNYAHATLVLIQAESQNVRWRDDGTNPTASVGMEIFAGDSYWYNGDLTAIKFIEEAASAKLNLVFYSY